MDENQLVIDEDERLLAYILNSCDPNIPADENNYDDCSASRGSGDVVGRMIGKISRPNSRPCLLFTGHIGCRKSSELAEFTRRLNQHQAEKGLRPWFVVNFKALQYLNEYNVSSLELSLSIFEEFEVQLRKKGILILDSFFSNLWKKIEGKIPIPVNHSHLSSIYRIQSSIFKPGTFWKSLKFRVNSVALLTRAMAAIFRSIEPIRIFDFRSLSNSSADF